MSHNNMVLYAVFVLMIIVAIILLCWLLFFRPGSNSLIPPFFSGGPDRENRNQGGNNNMNVNGVNNKYRNVNNNVDGKNIGFDKNHKIVEVEDEINFSDIENRYSGIDIDFEKVDVENNIPVKILNKRKNPNK